MRETRCQGDVGHRSRFVGGPQRLMCRIEAGAFEERRWRDATPLAKPGLQASYAHSELRRDFGYGRSAHRPLLEDMLSLQDEATTCRFDGLAKTFAVVVRMTMQQQRQHEFIQRPQRCLRQGERHAVRGGDQMGCLLPGAFELVREGLQREADRTIEGMSQPPSGYLLQLIEIVPHRRL